MPAVPVADNWEAWPFYIVCDVSSSMHDHKFSEYWGSEVSPWRRLFSEIKEYNGVLILYSLFPIMVY